MAGVLDVHIASYAVADPTADNKKLFLLRAPDDDNGGGIRLVGAYAVNEAALAGAGTTFTFALHKYSSAGTPAVNGTISNTIGSATQWEALVPQEFTLDSDYSFIDAGEWVVLQYNELNSANATRATVVLQYVMGS